MAIMARSFALWFNGLCNRYNLHWIIRVYIENKTVKSLIGLYSIKQGAKALNIDTSQWLTEENIPEIIEKNK